MHKKARKTYTTMLIVVIYGLVGLWVIIFSFFFSVFSNFSTMNMYYLCNKN